MGKLFEKLSEGKGKKNSEIEGGQRRAPERSTIKGKARKGRGGQNAD